eukprot:CAMPEP_0168453060 /NCGR_PEP_ID=MMETSP0228-20121227/49488_1 /TAXON_ID=133427 /ORGANISM="Protoceratium reticulatum, Strain CCCM 535 (=CCMP 1889)" /LENGTH=450 /DNA_ID=CAMNT_0008467759 /DNA_START=32 /DNA_END=1384 /DNA_ORIENTATION=+
MAPTSADAADEAAAKARRAQQLRIIHWHYLIGCCHLVMPFAQKPALLLGLPQFQGDISKVAVKMATMTSMSGAVEFFANPILGKLSDALGRKAFLMLGPIVNIFTYMLVWSNPSVATMWLQSLIGVSLNTFSGTTCTMASLSDMYSSTPQEFALAMGGLMNPVGIGLIIGPLLGSRCVRASGQHRAAFLGAAIVTAVQLLNVFRLEETLIKSKLKPFRLSFADLNPASFLRLFQQKGRSVLAKLSLVCGSLMCADEGKNLADVHQSYALQDVGMSDAARANFVSGAGVCVLINARSSKRTLKWFGGPGHTTFSNLISLAVMIYWATVPLVFRKTRFNSLSMYLGLLLGCTGWSAGIYVRAQGALHAQAAGIGNGEYSAMLANMRSVTSAIAPILYSQIYKWSVTGGRYLPGLVYLFCSLFKLASEGLLRTMSQDEIEGKAPEGGAGGADR